MKNIIFVLLLNFPLLATNFISDIDLDRPAINSQDLESMVIEQAKIKKAYLALGESHLQADTVLPLILKYASLFSENKNRYDLCAESIDHAIKHPIFKQVSQLAKKTIISAGNNPKLTDFKKCNKRKNMSKIYYSGFFHQFPFARAYPLEFAQVPVITQPGNNIWKQNSQDGLFIMMMEMVHLESTASREVFFSAYSPKELLTNYQSLAKQIHKLKSKMQDLNGMKSTFQKKWGYIANSSQLGSIAQKYSPKKAYFIITELDYRMNSNGLRFLRKFTQLSSEFQNKIISIGPKSKYLVSSFQTARKKSDLDGSTGYGTMPYRFELGTSFFQFKIPGQNLLMVSEPSHESFRYFDMKTQAEMDFDQFEVRL